VRDITKEVVIKESLIDVDEQEKIRLKRKRKSRKKSFLNKWKKKKSSVITFGREKRGVQGWKLCTNWSYWKFCKNSSDGWKLLIKTQFFGMHP